MSSELQEYIANKFIKRERVDDDENFIIIWQNWLKNFTPSEIINNFMCPVNFVEPENVIIDIYNSFAGRIPIIIFENAQDFENFITNLFKMGHGAENLSQIGASFISGKTQRFLALSKKFYSNINPSYLKLTPEEWREKSLIIRREHEITHYYTKKFYGNANNNLHDELIADFTGIYAAFNQYSAKLFRAKNELAKIAVTCANNLENWTKTGDFAKLSTQERINFLCEIGIKGMCKLV